jgi:type IV secretion system protein TrbL
MHRSTKLGVAAVLSNVLIVAAASPASADVPGTGIVQDVLSGATGWAFDEIAEGIAKWVLGAVAFFVEGALHFLQNSARPQVEADWFAGPESPFAAVRNIAAVLLLAFAFLGILQGLLHGEIGLMVRQVAGKLPLAVIGMVVTVAAVGKLLDLTDALSAAVLATTDDQALHFLSGFGVAVTGATSGFAAVVLGLVAVIAALILWIELLVRASLVYLLVAISPLGFAAMLWPSARGVLRKTIELLVAVILSKFVIAVALSIGTAALAGAGEAAHGSGGAGAGLATLLVGSVVVGLAAFAPFIVLKLVPVAEGAMAAHGVSRGPVRAMQSGASTYNSVSRLAGGGAQRSHASRASGSSGTSSASGPRQTATQAGSASKAGTASAGVAAGVATAGIAAAAAATRRTGAAADRAADGGTRSREQRSKPQAPARTERRSGE